MGASSVNIPLLRQGGGERWKAERFLRAAFGPQSPFHYLIIFKELDSLQSKSTSPKLKSLRDCLKQFLFSYRGINKGMPPGVVGWHLLRWWSNRILLLGIMILSIRLSDLYKIFRSLKSLLFNDMTIDYPTAIKCQDVVTTPGKCKL